ncbi:hypothetical protein EXM22_08375 [Oceanispirochaeta crateris]|jgi:hypothetical protein|uniref:Uncharacterized protein n=1 Tax=Oceanispirochaeta crateris TaxID=2518645 RepID=A0A5C1QKK2_9SPIO|nr:hypothetical protein [Oceanispirochaeta crateris]QEN07997.1 hypothetical protein EXM22_08375 [Oceanispirochaeta crateris]
MKRKDLILNLIGEISNYLLDENPMRLVVSLHQEEDGLHLCILDDNKHTEDELDSMRKALNSRKRPELAEYYGAMTGHDMLGSARLDLLGWQVKHSDVVQTDSGIKIDLWFGGDRFQSHQFTIPVDK